jgi:hypothetical protein
VQTAFVHSATGEEVSIFVPEDDEPKTKAAKVMASIGFKPSDKKSPNIAIGAIGIVMLVVPALVIVAADFNTLRRHLGMMKRNLQSGYRRIRQRGAKVTPQ